MPNTSFMMTLDNGRIVPAITIPPNMPLVGLSHNLGIPPVRGTIALVGGAGSFDKPEYDAVKAKIKPLIDEIAELAIAYKLAVVDGGTPYGAMRMMGEACYARNFRFSLLGVAPNGKVAWTSDKGLDYQQTWFAGMTATQLMRQLTTERTPLDTNHSAFLLVEANEWGEEVDMLAAAAHHLAGTSGTVEVLINGGEISRHDVAAFLRRGGNLVTIEGSGRFADELARASRTGYHPDPYIVNLLQTRRIHTFPLGDSPKLFSNLLIRLAGW